MSNLKPGVRETMLCSSGDCARTTPGHELRSIQSRVSAATPSQWRDGIVLRASGNGWIELRLIESDQTAWVWNHTDLSRKAREGTPVALHALYGTLALGAERVNVLVAPTLPGTNTGTGAVDGDLDGLG